MPGIDLDKLYVDPDFKAMSDRDKKAVLTELGYGGTRAGGIGASMRAAGPEDAESGWSKAREAISRALFGDEDRAAAAEAGIGLQPTPSEMVTGVAEPALMALGSTAGLTRGIPAAAGGIRAGLGAAARSLGVSTAGATGATVGGSVGAKVGHEVGFPTAGAVAGTLIGGALGGKVATGRAAAKAVIKPIPNAVSPIKVATEEAARKAHMARVAATKAKLAAKPSPVSPSATSIPKPSAVAAEAQKYEAEIVNLRTEHGQSGAQIVNALKRDHGISPSKGQVMVDDVLETHGIKSLKPGEVKIVPRADADVMAKRAFAKEAVPSGTFGDRIWLLMENGKPAKVLTSGQAGAASRAGKETTYITNTWGGK